ncbi:hypothetical protein LEP1GSC188_1203 [Leptospira weilii serovar Topaz str. LT2116]|uniref:Uncharacterized protein n=1 Tax=Leptospira weilii serovar Topaz str. LT2116 TaxID=1088540 RepID=M3FTZ4_9LEPT|nr:hypothetical protein LEP1GSC188_1203 [Leptospira weilii serovar Topaz str. LT2116]
MDSGLDRLFEEIFSKKITKPVFSNRIDLSFERTLISKKEDNF